MADLTNCDCIGTRVDTGRCCTKSGPDIDPMQCWHFGLPFSSIGCRVSRDQPWLSDDGTA